MKSQLYILRHGETLFNVQRKTQGWCDSPLTKRGIEQARIAGRMLADRGLDFDALYSSTSERCCDTLELALEAGWGSVRPYERSKGLKEHNFGVFEGKDQCLELFPHADFYKLHNYGGETDEECLTRFTNELDRIMAKGHERVLAVSHGGASIMFFHAVVPNPEPGTVPFGNCICQHYEYDTDLAGQGLAAFSWVETLVPDLSALEDPSLPEQIKWR